MKKILSKLIIVLSFLIIMLFIGCTSNKAAVQTKLSCPNDHPYLWGSDNLCHITQESVAGQKDQVQQTVPEQIVAEQPQKKCPETCDDNNVCTRDYCGSTTNYDCVNNEIKLCCGNGVCQFQENNANCPGDCPKTNIDSTTGATRNY